ncbi:hypothetical protein VTI28DRAFT_1419 [Corynascus sepedonium]
MIRHEQLKLGIRLGLRRSFTQVEEFCMILMLYSRRWLRIGAILVGDGPLRVAEARGGLMARSGPTPMLGKDARGFSCRPDEVGVGPLDM